MKDGVVEESEREHRQLECDATALVFLDLIFLFVHGTSDNADALLFCEGEIV